MSANDPKKGKDDEEMDAGREQGVADKARMAENNPWTPVEFDPDEADAAGAFREEAVSPEDAEDGAEAAEGEEEKKDGQAGETIHA